VDGQVIKTLIGHTDYVLSLTVFQDGRVASGSKDNTIRIWNIENGQTTNVLTGHNGQIGALTVLPDGRLASGSSDWTIRLWGNINFL